MASSKDESAGIINIRPRPPQRSYRKDRKEYRTPVVVPKRIDQSQTEMYLFSNSSRCELGRLAELIEESFSSILSLGAIIVGEMYLKRTNKERGACAGGAFGAA